MKNRSAGVKTIYILEHHAKPLKDLVFVVWTLVLSEGWSMYSERGGPNSWRLCHPNGRTFSLRGRLEPPRLEIDGRTFSLRSEIIKWFEKNQ